MADIVKRLKRLTRGNDWAGSGKTIEDAIAEIERLRQRNPAASAVECICPKCGVRHGGALPETGWDIF